MRHTAQFLFSPHHVPGAKTACKPEIADEVGFSLYKCRIGGKYYHAVLYPVSTMLHRLKILHIRIRRHTENGDQVLPNVPGCIATDLTHDGGVDTG